MTESRNGKVIVTEKKLQELERFNESQKRFRAYREHSYDTIKNWIAEVRKSGGC